MSDDGDGQPMRRFFSASDDDSVFTPGVLIRIKYALYLFTGLLITMLFQSVMSTFFDSFDFLQKGCLAIGGELLQSACTSEMMVYRVSFSLCLFFLIHWLSVSDLTCCIRSKARAEMQEGFFYFKTIMLVLVFILTLFIPNSFFAGYAYVCLFSSAFFLLMNVVFLVDFSYQWSDDWGARSEENPKWMFYLLAVAVGSYLAALVIAAVSFYLFVPHSNCNFNAFALTTTLVAALLFTVTSIWVPHGSVVPSGIVFLYTVAILAFTLRTEPSEHCNRLAHLLPGGGDASSTGVGASVKQMLLGAVVSSVTLAYAVVSSGGSWGAFNISYVTVDGREEEEDPDRVGHLSQYMFFYFIMMLGSMYLAMLATNWHVSGAGAAARDTSIGIAFYVRVVTVFLAVFLYMWSLLAPYTCCKDRDYGFDTDFDPFD